ncbi:MAG: serine hydrolase domain-containing protein [Pseudomonadota bacterium]
MILRFIAAAAMALAACGPTAQAADLNAILRTSMAASPVPAAGVLLMRDGKIEAQAVAGLRRSDGVERVGRDDVWLVGSTGKVMTVAMVARLVERGVLAWDAPLEKMLPQLAEQMRPEYRKVSLLELLSHRAGLARDLRDGAAIDTYFSDTRPLPQQRLAYIEAALREAPEVAPGTAFSYSNTGFLIAAAIAEKATGMSYEDLIRQEVFSPLGMRSGGSGNTHEGQTRGHQGGKPMLKIQKGDDGVPDMYAPAGFLHMSLNDWAQFNLDQLAGGAGIGKLLSPASYRLMQTRQAGSPAGLDWGVQDSLAGRAGPALVHQGSDGNWLAIVALFPQQGTGVLLVANAAADMQADKVLQSVFLQVLPELSPAKGQARPAQAHP